MFAGLAIAQCSRRLPQVSGIAKYRYTEHDEEKYYFDL